MQRNYALPHHFKGHLAVNVKYRPRHFGFVRAELAARFWNFVRHSLQQTAMFWP